MMVSSLIVLLTELWSKKRFDKFAMTLDVRSKRSKSANGG